MKSNYVAPELRLHILEEDVVTTSGIPEGTDFFDPAWS